MLTDLRHRPPKSAGPGGPAVFVLKQGRVGPPDTSRYIPDRQTLRLGDTIIATDPHTAWPPPDPGAVPLPFDADRNRGYRAGYAIPLSAGLRPPYRSRTGQADGSLSSWRRCRCQR